MRLRRALFLSSFVELGKNLLRGNEPDAVVDMQQLNKANRDNTLPPVGHKPE